MQREGSPMTPPRSIEVYVPSGVLAEYQQAADRRREDRGYDSRSDQWGKGLVDDPIVCGLVGEYAAATVLNAANLGLSLTVDLIDRPTGDGGQDFNIVGKTVQVKTRFKRGLLLIRRETENGRLLPINWHVCIFCTWTPEQKNLATVDGWIHEEQVGKLPFRPARKGKHMNLEGDDTWLESMISLYEYIEVCQRWREFH